MHAAAKSLQSCPTLCDPRESSPAGSAVPGGSPGKNTGVGCHFLLQGMKAKSQSEVTQSCLTPSDPMDRSPPGSSVHGIFQARVLEWGAINFSKVVYISFQICYPRYMCMYCICYTYVPVKNMGVKRADSLSSAISTHNLIFQPHI